MQKAVSLQSTPTGIVGYSSVPNREGVISMRIIWAFLIMSWHLFVFIFLYSNQKLVENININLNININTNINTNVDTIDMYDIGHKFQRWSKKKNYLTSFLELLFIYIIHYYPIFLLALFLQTCCFPLHHLNLSLQPSPHTLHLRHHIINPNSLQLHLRLIPPPLNFLPMPPFLQLPNPLIKHINFSIFALKFSLQLQIISLIIMIT